MCTNMCPPDSLRLLRSWVAPTLLAVIGTYCSFQGRRTVLSEYLAARPAMASAGNVVFALERRCPVSGIPQAVALETFGRPERIDTLRDDPQRSIRTTWNYRLTRSGSVLTIGFHGDSLTYWQTEFREADWAAETWRRPASVPRAQVVTYVRSHPEVENNIKFAILQGCPAEGMSADALRAALGLPDFVEAVGAVKAQAHQRWVYRLSTSTGDARIALLKVRPQKRISTST